MNCRVMMIAKFLIVYLYGVFILNVVSIFYMNRANNNLDNRMEFLATLVLPIVFGCVSVVINSNISVKQAIWACATLIVFGPIVFFTHVALSL